MKDEFSINKLQKEIKRRIKQASDALLNDDKKTAQENLDWVNISDKLIDEYKKKPNKVKLSIIIGLATVLLIGLGLAIKIPKTNISLDAAITSVTLTLNSAWTIENRFSFSELNIDNLKEVDATFKKIEHSAPFDMDLKGNRITMDNIALSPKSIITIQIEDSNQNFILKQDSLDAQIQISKAHVSINDEFDTDVNYEIPEILNIKSFPSIATPITISFSDTNNWSFMNIPVSEINFQEETPPGSGKFNSTILSGKIKILEIGKEYPLEEGDWLSLKHLECKRIKISKIKNLIKIHIEGRVDKVSTRTGLFEQNLKPSIAEYLYYAKTFAFFWSCIIFMWSLLWSLKNSIFTKA